MGVVIEAGEADPCGSLPSRLDHTVPVEGLHAEPGSLHLLSHSGRLVKGWRVQQLYQPSTLIGSHAHFLRGTTHPKVGKP